MKTAAIAALTFLEIVTPTGHKKFTVDQMKSKIKTAVVTIDDPIHKKSMTYDAFPLNEVLALAGPLPKEADEIVFQAADGYAPSIALEKTRTHKAFLAFQEHSNPKQWTKVRQGKSMVWPAPFYVVWDEGSKLSEEFPAPYQLVKVELVSFAQKFTAMYPESARSNERVTAGFKHFKGLCMRCHSVNLQGGDLAPELNVPKNVTEYWSKDNLRAFIKSASSFRAKSKMPDFPHIKTDEIDQILAYLEFMKEHKM